MISERGGGAPKEGDEHSEFATFFRSEYRAVVRTLMFAGASAEEAQDATQDAMTEIFLQWDRVHQPKAWVRKAALNRYIRSARRDRDLPERLAAGGWRQEVERAADGEVGEAEWVLALVRRLPPKQRQVLALSFDGLTSPEIANIVGDNPQATRKNLQLARDRLKKELARLDPE